MREYSLSFTKLSKYALFIVADLRARMSKFISGVSKKGKMAMHVKEMDNYQIMTYIKQIELDKLRDKVKESKRTWLMVGDILTKEVEVTSSKMVKNKVEKSFPTLLLPGLLKIRGRSKASNPKFP